MSHARIHVGNHSDIRLNCDDNDRVDWLQVVLTDANTVR